MPKTLPRPSHSFRTRLLSAALVVFYGTTLTAPYARAQDSGRRNTGSRDIVTSTGSSGRPTAGGGTSGGGSAPSPSAGGTIGQRIGVPGIETPTGVSAQAISLPTAEGSIQGMGESFTPSLSSGTGSFGVPIAVAPGRNGVQPSFGLGYSTSAGNGPLGIGWSFGTPRIARQTDRGLPRYVDREQWQPEEDRFIDGSGNELVPVDASAMATVDASGRGYSTGLRPSDVGADWQEYRARLEGGFNRIFRSPDWTRWVVLSKDGGRSDFGVLPAGTVPSDLDSSASRLLDPAQPERTFAWYLTRDSDPHGSTVYYTYERDRGQIYLRDAYYVSPAACAPAMATVGNLFCTSPLSSYGARVHFEYTCPGSTDPATCRQDRFVSYVSGFRVETAWRLSRITVTAYEDGLSARALVRRYHLAYVPGRFHSQLASVQMEGRPETPEPTVGVRVFGHVRETELGDAIVGPTLPPIVFGYSTLPVGSAQAVGFGGLSSTVRSVLESPPVALGASRSDLFDVNGDGLPDLLVTDPARYRGRDDQPATGVYFNGFRGPNGAPAGRAATFSQAIPVPMDASLANVLNLDSGTVVPMDVEGDGRADLMHLPRTREYGWFTPARTNTSAKVSIGDQGWQFAYARVQLPANESDPRIDFLRDPTHYRVLDVNNDHLVDVVRTTGTSMETWLNLGWQAQGEGRFGQASYVGGRWTFTSEPISSCVLHDGTPVDFADPTIRLGDLNGDGIQDIARVQRGRVTYWPGRGGASWGEGSIQCSMSQGANRHVTMSSAPADLGLEQRGVSLVDVDHDGLDDVLQVRFNEIDVWFNQAGRSFTERVTVRTPFAADFANSYRLADLDGSGTMDIVYGIAGNWRFVDLLDGVRPRLLNRVDNDMGSTTTLRHGSSTDDYLADLASAASADASCSTDNCDVFTWDQLEDAQCDAVLQRHGDVASCYRRSGHSPLISSVVRSLETTDNFDQLGQTANVIRVEYAYHDAYYDGLEQEFRGFRAADLRQHGDEHSPTSLSRTWFLQGRRPVELMADRSVDNPNEALKGRVSMSETFDEAGHHLGTTHATFVIRKLATGLDGRAVSFAYVSQNDELIYDTSSSVGPGPVLTLDAFVPVTVASGGGIPTSTTATETHDVQIRSADYAWIRSTTDVVDNVGNVLESTAYGRIHDEEEPPSTTPSVRYDEVVKSFRAMTLLAGQCGTSAPWAWRTKSGYVTGSDAHTRLQEAEGSYSCAGDPRAIVSHATTTRTDLDFGALGSPPADQLLISSTLFDAWGQTNATCAGADLSNGDAASSCLRYGELHRDSIYTQIVTRESVAVDASAGGHCDHTAPLCLIDTVGTWDRGWGVTLATTDPNGISASVRFDGLGQLVYLLPPNTDGCVTSAPPTVVRYQRRPGDLPLNVVETTIDSRTADCQGANTVVAKSYVDGFGRVRAMVSPGDSGDTWIRSGSQRYGAKGQAICGYDNSSIQASEPTPQQAIQLPTSPGICGFQDAFGRLVDVVDYRDPSAPRAHVTHHALGQEMFDPLDLGQGLNGRNHLADTPTRLRLDGHGRTIAESIQLRRPGETEKQYIQTFTGYRADGAILYIYRVETTDDQSIDFASPVDDHITQRTFTYDSIGRRLTTLDPDSDDLSSESEATKHWRYLYNRVGDLVAVRDPRGCGQDFFFDRAGRVIGERYVGCDEAQASGELSGESVPIGSIGADVLSSATTVDVRNYYDVLPPWESSFGTATTTRPSNGHYVGRATGTADRGRRALVAFDARGLAIWGASQLAILPEAANDVPASWLEDTPTFDGETIAAVTRSYDTTFTYTVTSSFDHLGRPRASTLPEDPDGVFYGGGTGAPSIGGRISYSRRGMTDSVVASIGGVDYPVLAGASYDVNGLPTSLTWGRSGRTVSETFEYDARLRPTRHTVTLPTLSITNPLDVAPGVTRIVDERYGWDLADNLVQVTDESGPSRLPDGHRQVRQSVEHDSLYRVVSVNLEYRQNASGSTTTWGPDDLGTDWREERTRTTTAGGDHLSTDPMHREPAPMLPSLPTNRARNFTYDYDWLGNMTEWTDDASAFFERSLGSHLHNGNLGQSGFGEIVRRPSALYFATDIAESAPGTTNPAIDRGGYVSLEYGVSGNVVGMTAHARCHDRMVDMMTTLACYLDTSIATTPEEKTGFLAENCACDAEQHYEYRWDELNRLAEARRYDHDAASPTSGYTLETRQRYRYDSSNGRTLKQTLDVTQSNPDLVERIQLYVLPGSFLRSGVGLDRTNAKYVSDTGLGSETQYVVGGARMVFRSGAPPASGYDDDHRFTMGFSNLIHSTAAVVDLMSSELLELSTYLPNGQRETHLTSHARPHAIEPDGFTGKEADEEVGLVYFGERYLIPQIGRWATPDPLAIHEAGGGEALNSYHYVAGNLLQARDPIGLDPLPGNIRIERDVPRPEGDTTGGRVGVCSADGQCHGIPGLGSTLTLSQIVEYARAHPDEIIGIQFYTPLPPTEAAPADGTAGDAGGGAAGAADGSGGGSSGGGSPGGGSSGAPSGGAGGSPNGGPSGGSAGGSAGGQRGHYGASDYAGAVLGGIFEAAAGIVIGGLAGKLLLAIATFFAAPEILITTVAVGLVLLGTYVITSSLVDDVQDIRQNGFTPSNVRATVRDGLGLAGIVYGTYRQFRPAAGAACPGGRCPCFVADTLVATTAGLTPIEQIRVGMRVTPSADACESMSVEGWHHLRLRTSSHDGDVFDVDLLRPSEWIEATGAVVGASIDLDLTAEMNVRGSFAVVTSEIFHGESGGHGCPVTGTIRHVSDDLVDLSIEDEPDLIRATSNHPFYSIDRNSWISAGELQEGELVQAANHLARVVHSAVAFAPRPIRVFNLEVAISHVYEVGRTRILVHNQYGALGLAQRTANVFGACRQFAASMRRALMARNVRGALIEIEVPENMYVYSDTAPNPASTRGVGRALGERGMGHSAVRVGDRVYDNLRPGGMSYEAFIEDLGGASFFGRSGVSITETPF